MANNGKQGERLFAERMVAQGYIVNDVSKDPRYWTQDIDFFCINPETEQSRSFEVKWCEHINRTGNLFLETVNPRSRQWSGQGWWPHCKADFLVYGDAAAKKFYCFPLLELRERVNTLNLRSVRTGDYSEGLLLPLAQVIDLAIEL